MSRRKSLQELTLKDNFMFGAVMSDENHCRRLLELILQFPIERVEVSKEKSIAYHPQYKGVRLDVYAKDAARTHYNVEMQAVWQRALGKRSRYYHSQIDMELLSVGTDYTELPDTYVIFICDFDPFGEQKYRYTFYNRCVESEKAKLNDGHQSIFLSTVGKNAEEVPEPLVKFLKYVHADLRQSTEDFGDAFVESLQASVRRIKENREMEERFMILHEMMREERAEGKAEGKAEDIIELLEELGAVSEALREKIMSQMDLTVLKQWLKLAAKADSIGQFEKEM